MKTFEQKKNYKGILVIGAGLPRTGTTTMKSALGTLLDGSCYHMVDHFNGTNLDIETWNKACEGKATKGDWIQLLECRGFNSAVDFPAALFYK